MILKVGDSVMKKKIMIAGMILSFCCTSSSTVMAAEIVNVQSEVNANKNATVRADRIDYVYKVIDGKIVEHGGAANTFETFIEHHLVKPV